MPHVLFHGYRLPRLWVVYPLGDLNMMLIRKLYCICNAPLLTKLGMECVTGGHM